MGKKAAAAAPVAAAEAPEEEEEDEPPLEVLEGDFSFPDGSDYSGEYIVKHSKPLMHGKGRLQTWPEVFEGSFVEGLYREGTFTGADGSSYKGMFHNNLFHGPGEYKWSDGRVYKGMWQDGLMHGRGEFENFSFGVDRVFSGFCVRGQFLSGETGQERARQSFLSEYQASFTRSASEALQEIASRLAPPEPADPKAKKGAVEDAPVEWPREFTVPIDDSEEAAQERATVETFVAGPFPDVSAWKPALFQTFAACFAEGAPEPGTVTVLESCDQACGAFAGAERLKCEQLSYAGQAVLFSAPASAEGGAIAAAVLVNACPEYHVMNARWKLVFSEDVPIPPEDLAADEGKAKKK